MDTVFIMQNLTNVESKVRQEGTEITGAAHYSTHLSKELLSIIHTLEQDHTFGFLPMLNNVMGHIVIIVMPLWKSGILRSTLILDWIWMMMVGCIVPCWSMLDSIISRFILRSMSMVWATTSTSTPSPTTMSPSTLKGVWVVVVYVIVVI